MKKVLAVIILLIAVAGVFAQGSGKKGKKGEKISFSSRDLNGIGVTDAIFKDTRITMIHIWGTFCPPCIREMPDLSALARSYKAKSFAVIGIPLDLTDSRGTIQPGILRAAKAIIRQTGADYLHIVPTEDMLTGFLKNVQAVPMTFFVDSSGERIGQIYTGAKNLKEWQAIINNLLE
ncbi:MAG: TlpA family protein disulfide reductase [Treponema sp.]|nr:TlpA family protein disulfide reductase [Treponema sp.]